MTEQLDLFAAQAARDDSMALAENATGADWDRAIIDHAIRTFAATGREFSSNDLRDLLPDVRPSLIGSRFLAACKRGDLIRVGDTLAAHKAGHARRISTWRAAALSKLLTKPEVNAA